MLQGLSSRESAGKTKRTLIGVIHSACFRNRLRFRTIASRPVAGDSIRPQNRRAGELPSLCIAHREPAIGASGARAPSLWLRTRSEPLRRLVLRLRDVRSNAERPGKAVCVQLNCFERLRAGMCRSKRDVIGRMPVLSHHDVRKSPSDPIYDRHHLLAILYREAPAIQQ